MSANCKTDYKLSDIIKEIRLIRKSVPTTKVIIQWLRGTEFDTIDENGNDVGLKKVYDYKTYKRLKIFIDTAIKNKLAEKRSQNKQARVYLYLYAGGTPELKDKIRIDVKDHLTTKQCTPRGCDKYCTDNQIGKPANWVKLMPILLPDGNYFERIKQILNDFDSLTKVSSDTYQVDNADNIINIVHALQITILTQICNDWYESNFKN